MPNARHCTHSHDEQFAELRNELAKLAKQQTHALKLLKEIKTAMAITQADIDEVKATNVAILTEVSKIGSDLAAVLNNPSLTLDEVKAQGNDIVTRLQSVDDLIPEQPTP